MKIALIIDDAAVPQVFNEGRIADLACILKLPSGSDLERFGKIVLSAIRNFVENAVQPTPNALAGEIRNLHQFASGKNFPALASAFEAMTPALRELLVKTSEGIEGHFCERAAYRVARGRLARDERSAWVADQIDRVAPSIRRGPAQTSDPFSSG